MTIGNLAQRVRNLLRGLPFRRDRGTTITIPKECKHVTIITYGGGGAGGAGGGGIKGRTPDTTPVDGGLGQSVVIKFSEKDPGK